MNKPKNAQLVGPDGRAIFSDDLLPDDDTSTQEAPMRYVHDYSDVDFLRQREIERNQASHAAALALYHERLHVAPTLPDGTPMTRYNVLADACRVVRAAAPHDRARMLTQQLYRLAELDAWLGIDMEDAAHNLAIDDQGYRDDDVYEQCLQRLTSLVGRFEAARMGVGDVPHPDDDVDDEFMPVAMSDVQQAAVAWVIPDILPANWQGFLYGREASFKSFLSYGWAAAICHGLPVNGRPTTRGSVAYIAAEGAPGARRRIEAWCSVHKVAVPSNLYLFSAAPMLDDPVQADAFLARIRALPEVPRLIVVDMLSKTMIGDENGQAPAKAYMRTIKALREATGAAVLIQHHAGKDGTFRGSSVFKGEADFVIKITREKGARSKYAAVTCEKFKDLDNFTDFRVEQHKITLPDGGTSMVLDTSTAGALSERHTLLMDLLEDYGEDGATFGELQKVCEAESIASATFERVLKALVSGGSVIKDGGQRGKYTLAKAEF